jgi:DUF438 domain-containing protein
MSELIDNSKFRKEKLKELILKLHDGEDPRAKEIMSILNTTPFDMTFVDKDD